MELQKSWTQFSGETTATKQNQMVCAKRNDSMGKAQCKNNHLANEKRKYEGKENQYNRENLCFPGSSDGKESAWNAGDPGSIPRLGRSPGEGIGYPIQYSWVSLVAQTVKNLPAMQQAWV